MGEKQKVMLPNRRENRGQQQPGRIKQALAYADFHDRDSAETIWEPLRELTATFGIGREHGSRIERLGMIRVRKTATPDFRVILDQTDPWILCEHVRADHAEVWPNSTGAKSTMVKAKIAAVEIACDLVSALVSLSRRITSAIRPVVLVRISLRVDTVTL